jgi:pimeloyl-ACP methyl ester carboxylesterase
VPFFTNSKNNVSIYYETYGQHGPWITFVNGYLRSHKDFRSIARKISTKNFRVLIFDNRGSGRTTSKETFSLKEMSDDIISLWKYLNISKSSIAGISMGGIIAQILSIGNEKYLDKMILISTTGQLNALNSLKEQNWPKDIISITDRMKKYVSFNFAKNNSQLIHFMAKEIQQRLNAIDDKVATQKNALMDYQTNILELNKINTETLIIHGEEDAIITYKAALYLKEHIKESKLIPFPQTGHLILAENFTKLYQEIMDFLKT